MNIDNLTSAVREALFNAYMGGFLASGEGDNGEHPERTDAQLERELRERFDKWIGGRS